MMYTYFFFNFPLVANTLIFFLNADTYYLSKTTVIVRCSAYVCCMSSNEYQYTLCLVARQHSTSHYCNSHAGRMINDIICKTFTGWLMHMSHTHLFCNARSIALDFIAIISYRKLRWSYLYDLRLV